MWLENVEIFLFIYTFIGNHIIFIPYYALTSSQPIKKNFCGSNINSLVQLKESIQ